MEARPATHAPSPPRRAAALRAAAVAGAIAFLGLCGPAACRSTPPDPPEWLVWLVDPPEGCALGLSGATLYPGEALRQARVDALTGLLRSFLETDLQSESFDDGDQRYAWTHQVSRGRLARSRVVALWSDPGGVHMGARVYALACEQGVRPDAAPLLDTPDWFLNPPSEAGRICAPAVAGPTLFPSDQRPAAIADGRIALAEALESDVQQIVVDDERHRVFEHSTLSATERARAAAQSADQLEMEWIDEKGTGPLAIRNTLYGLICADL
ncbi:MAG: hypothetical protein ACQGVK_03040 [Myxococcota bacterium]